VQWENARSILARLPQRELEIRRCYARDEHFRSVCGDYEEAMAALRCWERAAEEGHQRIQEYTNFLRELEAEILAYLERKEGQ
jgi:hypothetical protein